SSSQASISKSGIIDVTEGGTNQITKYFTDSQTFTKTLKNNAIVKINTVSSTTLTSSATSAMTPNNLSASLEEDNSTISRFKLDTKHDINGASSKLDLSKDNSLGRKKSALLEAMIPMKKQAQFKAEQSLEQNDVVTNSKSTVLSNNSSNEEQKQNV